MTQRPASDRGIGWEVTESSNSVPFKLDTEDRLKHVYILGSTGSGKTNLLSQLVEEDVRRGQSTVVVDMRGDLVDRLLGQIAGSIATDRIHLMDLRKPDVSAGINLFQCAGDPYSAALQMHSILRDSAESWGVQLDETLRCSLIALACARRSLTDLPSLLTNSAFRSRILDRTPDPNSRAFFDRFDGLPSEKQTAWILPVLNKVSPLLSHPTVRTVLSERKPLDLRNILDSPGSILLCALAADRLHGLAGLFGCLLVSSIENAIMQRVDQPENTRNPVHLYLDEFQNFQSSAFEAIVSEGRRFGLGLTLSHQNLSQIDRRLQHVITNNAATRIYFRTGQLDATELGRELAAYGARRPVETLLNMPVGKAFVVGQNGTARQVRFNEARQNQANPEKIRALLETLGRRSHRLLHEAGEGSEMSGVQHVRKPRAASRSEASA